jgi:hypothetical protein
MVAFNQPNKFIRSARHKYFAEKTSVFSTDALIVPETAMNLRNNLKEGKWFLGETEYGSKLNFICLKFSRRIAKEEYGAISPGTPLGQLWFCPVAAGESPNGQPLPANVVYYTLKYTRALVIGMAFNPTGHKPGWSYLPRWVDNLECPRSNGKDDGVLWHESCIKHYSPNLPIATRSRRRRDGILKEYTIVGGDMMVRHPPPRLKKSGFSCGAIAQSDATADSH